MEGIYTMHTLHGNHEPKRETIVDDWDCTQMQLAQAYVRPQRLEGIFSPEEGLRMGTIFPNLSKPYKKRGEQS